MQVYAIQIPLLCKNKNLLSGFQLCVDLLYANQAMFIIEISHDKYTSKLNE